MRTVAVALIVVACVFIAVSTAEAQLLKFDFGSPSSPLEPGYTRVTPESAWADAAGFGWLTKLRVIPSSDKWWNADEKGGILSAFDTKKGTALAEDYVFAFHFFGWPHAAEDKDGVNRLNIVMDDDLKTDFVARVKPGKWSVVVAMGDLATSHRLRPFNVEVNGKPLAQNLSCQTVTLKRADAVDCPDGRLVVTFRGATGYKHPYPWNQCTWWMVNWVLAAPSDEAALIDAELARIEGVQMDALKRDYVPAGTPCRFEVRDGYLAKDGKPFLRLLWHGWGWDDTLKYYRLYAWTNTLNLGPGNRQLFYYDDWFRDGWRARAASEAFPTDWFEQMNRMYPYGYLANFYMGRDYMQFLPPGYRKDHPDEIALDAKGRRQGSERYPGSPGGDLYTSRLMTVLADVAKLHPAGGTVELFEEYWVPKAGDTGFNPAAVKLYREWLKAKFKTIDALNEGWGANYKGFDDINPPKDPSEQSGNGVCHYVWRGEMEARAAKVAYDAIKAADPSRPVAGAKGTFPIASWYYAPATDIFGWYGHADMAIANAAAREFGKMTEPVHVNICQHQTMRGGIPVDKWPFMNYRESAYSLMLTRVIDGAKSIFNEDYVLGHDFHYFHVTKQMRGKDLEGTLGGKVTIDRDDYPDVYLEAKSLQLARANQALLRLAPVFLPTKQHRPRVAVLATDAADMHGGPSAYYGATVMQTVYLLKMCQVPFDVLREPQFGRFKDYDVLVLTGLCEALTPEAAKEVGLFVADGGKLLILLPTAGTDARNLKPLDFTWVALAGCRPGPAIDQGGELPITVNGVAGVEQLPGFKGLQKGKLGSLELIGGRLDVLAQVGDKPVAVRSARLTGHVVTACLPQMVPTWTALAVEPFDARTAKFFGEVFRMWNVTRPVELSGPGETFMVDAGVLDGNGYWLVLLASYGAEQKAVAKLNFLPAGNYDVIDLTGERPLITKDAAGQNHLAPDPQYRRCTYVAKDVSDKTLKSAGVSLDIGARMGRVLMVRPAGWQTWADCPDHEIETLARKPLVIVPGTGCEKMAAAVQASLKAIGNDAQIVSPDAIKTKKVTNKVVILDFPVETFESAPLEVKTNLILIGNETNNPLIKHLGAEGTFCFDKVLEKVDEKYPGAGRGIIEVVESVSNEAYDATANSCDAIVIAGSDAAGTQAAVNRFIDTLKARR